MISPVLASPPPQVSHPAQSDLHNDFVSPRAGTARPIARKKTKVWWVFFLLNFLWHFQLQKLPRIKSEYSTLTASAKRSFAAKLLKATLPPKLQFGEEVDICVLFSSSTLQICINHQGYDLWLIPVNIDDLPLTKKILSSLNQQELCLEDILPWKSYKGLDKFAMKPKGANFKFPIPSYNKFLDIYNEVND